MVTSQRLTVGVEGGGVPVWTSGPDAADALPGNVVIPSIFGPNPDLLSRMETLAHVATRW